jgi:hypothetical protein
MGGKCFCINCDEIPGNADTSPLDKTGAAVDSTYLR